MNKFKKLKQTKASYNEDSSDYISDAEGSLPPKGSRLDNDNDNSNSHFGHLADDYSNDSFDNNRDSFSGFSSSTKPHKGGSQLNESLEYLHKSVHRKDKEGIFEYPVTDLIAPGYSVIIKNPMDLSTMKGKIDSNDYTNIMEYRDDLVVMCDNCMTYNKPDTIYYQFAKKMRDYGFKLLSREKLLTLRGTLRCMRFLTADELGFSLEASDIYYDTNAIRKKTSENKIAVFKTDVDLSSLMATDDLIESDSRLIPPEGEDDEDIGITEEEITEMKAKIKEMADLAAQNLAKKNPNGKMGFLRRNTNGTLGFHALKEVLYDNDSDDSSESVKGNEPDKIPVQEEKAVTIGNLMEGLQASSFSMTSYLEEKKTSPINYIENGPFSNYGTPVEDDNSLSGLPKSELNVLIQAYGDELGAQYALSLMKFSKETGGDFTKYVKQLLMELTCNEHDKYLKFCDRLKAEANEQPKVKYEV